MKDSADTRTADMLAPPAPRRGRPAKHASEAERRAANAQAARAYRERKKAERAARRDPAQTISSRVIDLSELPAWRRG